MGIMGEMMNEAVDAAMDNDDLEEETDDEIAKVLDEVLAGNTKKRRKNPRKTRLFQAKLVNYPVWLLEKNLPLQLQLLMLIVKKMIWNDVYKHYEINTTTIRNQ